MHLNLFTIRGTPAHGLQTLEFEPSSFRSLDIIVMGTITGAPLLPFCALVTEA